jgi:hypothetical protein
MHSSASSGRGDRLILSAHQPAYLPWLGLFHKIAVADVFVILDGVQFEKNSFANRNKVKGPNGPVWLTVPVALKGHMNSTIRDIAIASNPKWQKKHWKTIQQAYAKAPYFERYSSFFEEIYSRDWKWLCELNWAILEYLLRELGIGTRVYHQTELSISGTGEDLILNLSRHFGAKVFVFGSLGEQYVTPEKFSTNGVDTHFQTYHHPEYPQLYDGFQSHLSVIDLLFNVGPHGRDLIMSGNVQGSQLIEPEMD